MECDSSRAEKNSFLCSVKILPSVKALDVECIDERSSTAMWWAAWRYWKTAAAGEAGCFTEFMEWKVVVQIESKPLADFLSACGPADIHI
jgi:hypothetical protein